MMGLAYLAAFGVYLIISLVVIGVVATRPKTWKWRIISGVLAALFMYNLVFWDYLPTKYAYEYYCKKEAGFWVYKTAKQWRAENPDVVVGSVKPPEGMVLDKKGNGEMLTADGMKLRFRTYRDGELSLSFEKQDGLRGYWLNNRFYYQTETNKNEYLPVRINIKLIVDSITKKVFVKRVNVNSGYGFDRSLKFWNFYNDCGPSVEIEKSIYQEFYQIKNGENK